MANNDKRVGVHYIKCYPEFFEMVCLGRKPFEVRKNDRNYMVGDELVMSEWDPTAVARGARDCEGYTGREVRGTITCAVGGSWMEPDYVVLGVLWHTGVTPESRGVVA